ncbi:MAG: 3-keto-disaccharide hydrolase [Verrucomicrobiia bacterium]|jgi:hypothetical protein
MKKNLILVFVGVAVLANTIVAFGAEEGWIDLFDGKTLKGWIQRGGKAKYTVEDGAIVGTTVTNTPNSFLCTEQEYSDFILELEFKVDPKLNSGVQIRSQCFDKPTEVQWQGKTIKIPANRVHGYQVEIDPSSRGWTGGIYDEARRGWLFDLKNKPEASKAFKQNDWNKIRVEAKGDTIKTWINGVPAAELKDSMTPKGFIALQVHQAKEAGLKVQFRNIRLKKLD